jgi:MerR family transcriptional regulator, light-induced transcriptional regulator
MDLAARSALAASLLADEALPGHVTDAFLSRHPEWERRFGPAGRRRCTEDARFHLSFLAGAVQAGTAEIFCDYVVWCAEMLASRNIDRAHLDEHLELLQEHLPAANDREGIVGRMLATARVALTRAAREVSVESPDERMSVRLAYLSAALAGRRGEAWEATRDATRLGVGIREIYRDVIVWTQRRLGELWTASEITVAQEHMASAVTQSVLARLYAEIPGDRPSGRVLMAGVEGELHGLPAQLASDFLELDGWDVAFVGTHAPQTSVLAAIEAARPDVLGLSTTMAFNLPKTVALVRAVQRQFSTLPIVLGGRACRGAIELAKELSVDVDVAGDGAPFRAFARVS